MDKGLGAFYNKLSTLFHSNTSQSSNTPTVPEISSSLPLKTFFDRVVPTTTSSPIDQRHSTSRISRQISIKTNDNRITTPNNLPKQQK